MQTLWQEFERCLYEGYYPRGFRESTLMSLLLSPSQGKPFVPICLPSIFICPMIRGLAAL